VAADGKAGKRKNPLFGAAVLKEILRRRLQVEPAPKLATGRALPAATDGVQALYLGVLRDLGLTDAQVDEYLAAHADEVDDAIKGHGRRGP
jgi:hypothetical protein